MRQKITYYSYSCPSCNAQDGPTKTYRFRYGSPFRICKKCGTQFVNRNYHEITISGLPKDEKQALCLYIITLIIFIVLIALNDLGHIYISGDFVAGLVLLSLFDLMALAVVALRVLPAIFFSKRRTSDPEYRRKVIDLYRS